MYASAHVKAKAAAAAATVAGAKRSRQQLAEDDGDDGDTGMACQRGICVVYCFDDIIPLKLIPSSSSLRLHGF